MNTGICSFKPKCFKYLYVDKVKNNVDNILNFLETCFNSHYVHNTNKYHSSSHTFISIDEILNDDAKIIIDLPCVFLVFMKDKEGYDKIEVYTEKQFNNIFNIEKEVEK